MIKDKKLVIVLPAYNAELTLQKTYNEIPFDIVDDVILVDDLVDTAGTLCKAAQAIMENQKIILLDEPFNALDFKTNQEIVKVLRRLKADGKTIIMTSHQHEYLEKICDYII